ncbi:unnamed protein product [Moneuplotes crassus]|uniref:Uncharacterized protein n=1 Tax=Euplotes crassus TaxID=5936 RepID=A0AAD2D5T3_EUPCR|nr:unnamed protein product [Moneuplotes crassus]
MGNKSSSKKPNETLEEEYTSIGLPKISGEDLENDLERELYIAINMCRYNPKRMTKFMKPLKKLDLLSKQGIKSIEKAKKMLKNMEPLPPLAIYADGIKACKEISNQYFADPDEFKEDPEKVTKEANSNVIKTLEETRKGMEVKGDSRVITGIKDEQGVFVILSDICEWVGDGKPGLPPYLERIHKKIGLNVYPITEENQACTMVLIEDFTNSMI